MKDLKRNLIYWGWTLEKISFLMIVCVLVMWGILTFMEGKSFAEGAVETLGMYLVMLIFLSAFNNMVNGVKVYFPFTISMGSTRQASFIAMQIVQHLILFEYVVLAGIIYYFVMQDVFGVMTQYLLGIIGAILLLQAILNLVSMFFVKYGNKGGMVAYMILIVACVVVALYGSMSGLFENGEVLNVLKNFVKKPYLLGIGAAFDVITTGVYYISLKKKDLRL